MDTRKVYRLKAGNFADLKITEEDLSPPQEHEVRIKVRAIGLNFADLFAIWGLYSATPNEAFIPGLEIAGEIERVGAKASNFQVGDRVMAVTRFGGYCSHLNLDARYVRQLPDGWTMQEGAAYLVQALTAYYGLFELGAIQENSTVLIHSGAGGVGVFANRLAKSRGAYTIGTTGSPAKTKFMQHEGYDRAIVRSPRFSEDLQAALNGRNLDIIMECIGGKILQQSFAQLAPEGRMIVYGAARYASTSRRPNYPKLAWQFITRPKIDPQSLPETNRSVMGFNLIWLYDRVEKMNRLLNELQTFDLGRPHVGHEFTFGDLPQALELFKSGKTMGKVVVTTS